MLIDLQLFLCFVWILWTKGSVQPQFLGITTTKPARCVRSSSTPAAEGAATTSYRGIAAWTCVLKVREWGMHVVQVSTIKSVAGDV